MNTKRWLTGFLALSAASTLPAAPPGVPSTMTPTVIVSTAAEPIKPGIFEPTWQSLEQYQAPDWFRDAKFGIWAHWGAQCQPERGDWYAREMYQEGSGKYKSHLEKYGHPSKSGFKEVIHEWKAEKWDPDKLVTLYKRVGAQYFFAMANHHDNFDNWDSKYQPWNSVALGPKKDLMAGWARAAHAQGLPFGVSVHAAHAWTWYETSQGADKTGEFAGVPYDGKLRKADGKGQWWDGLDPQELYAQNHARSANPQIGRAIHDQWNWGNGASLPSQAFAENFYNRTVDLINRYHPELIYFDDTALPLWPASDAGLKIAAHFYNTNRQQTNGRSNGVLLGKILDEQQRKALVWDIERGAPNAIQPLPWQTDTCLGNWHYERSLYDRNGYKSAKTVIQTLADVVSKNGNLLLNVPVRGDGSIDEKEEAVLEGVAAWMDVNKECIFGTRPWKVFGEGPASAGAALAGQGFNEGKGKPFTAGDVRFTVGKDGALYAIVMGRPTAALTIKSVGTDAKLLDEKTTIARVELLGGSAPVRWTRTPDGMVIEPPPPQPKGDDPVVYKFTLAPS